MPSLMMHTSWLPSLVVRVCVAPFIIYSPSADMIMPQCLAESISLQAGVHMMLPGALEHDSPYNAA